MLFFSTKYFHSFSVPCVQLQNIKHNKGSPWFMTIMESASYSCKLCQLLNEVPLWLSRLMTPVPVIPDGVIKWPCRWLIWAWDASGIGKGMGDLAKVQVHIVVLPSSHIACSRPPNYSPTRSILCSTSHSISWSSHRPSLLPTVSSQLQLLPKWNSLPVWQAMQA